jgi:hypothetical protein
MAIYYAQNIALSRQRLLPRSRAAAIDLLPNVGNGPEAGLALVALTAAPSALRQFMRDAVKGRCLKRGFVKRLQNRRNACEMLIVSHVTFKTAQTVEQMASRFA